jgi:bifunctional DNA-binding transcriptional regulator/antitoxin component of YhaV-PrlF toxin-antitoxin module
MKISTNLSNGRAVIPAAFRTQLDIKDGDELIWSVRGGDLVVTTRRAQLLNTQAKFQKMLGLSAPSLATELIAQRRAEAAADSK